MATHARTLAWRIPWTGERWGCKESDTTEWLTHCAHRYPCSSAGQEATCETRDPGLIPWSGRPDGEGIGYPLLPTPVFWNFPNGSTNKGSACNAGDLGSIPGLGRSPGREWLSTPVFWPGDFYGLYNLWWSQRVGHDWSTFTSLCALLAAHQKVWYELFSLKLNAKYRPISTVVYFLICNTHTYVFLNSNMTSFLIIFFCYWILSNDFLHFWEYMTKRK